MHNAKIISEKHFITGRLKFACDRKQMRERCAPFSCILVSNEGIFLEIRASNYPCMHYKRSTFGCLRSIIRDTLLGQRCAFLAVSAAFIDDIYQKIQSCLSISLRYKCSKFYCDRSLIKGTLVGEQCAFMAVSRLLLQYVS